MQNLTDFNEFSGKKRNTLNENVIKMGDTWKARINVDIPISLVNAYIKKVKDESGTNIREQYSDIELVEMLATYMVTSYMNIENFPASIAIGTESTSVQPKIQGQPQGMQGQPQGMQGQTTQTQVPVQDVQAQSTAEEIPSTEGQGQTPPPQGQGQTPPPQGQGQKPQGGGQVSQAI